MALWPETQARKSTVWRWGLLPGTNDSEKIVVRAIVFSMCVIGCLLIEYKASFASEALNVGTNQRGLEMRVGYQGAQLSYKESIQGAVADKDTGWLNGGFFELRGDNRVMFTRFTLDFTLSNSAKYTGSIQNGGILTPTTMVTRDEFYKTEMNIGAKVLNYRTFTLAPYAGIGYRYWIRGQNSLPDYQEDYSWWYAAAGANLAFRHAGILLSLDAAAIVPFSLAMKTSISGTVDDLTFRIRSEPGFRVDAPARFDLVNRREAGIFLFVTPFYELWNVGASDAVTLTSGGVPIRPLTNAFEPRSSTAIYGLRTGLGINF